jgi:hypothetical protein
VVVQIRPGGLAAFPVDVVQGGIEEEALTVMVEVNRGLKPTQQKVEELFSFVRAAVRNSTMPPTAAKPTACLMVAP